jgi:hypothetical protein
LLPPASHAAEVGPCALLCGASLLEETLDCASHGGTKALQRPPGEVCQEVQEFQDFIHLMLQVPERDLCWIINMDQTAVFFRCIPKKN